MGSNPLKCKETFASQWAWLEGANNILLGVVFHKEKYSHLCVCVYENNFLVFSFKFENGIFVLF
jgi:hypothetical protein